MLLTPIGALLAAFAITAYIVQKARGVSETDRVTMWFSCARFLRWLMVGTFLAWWVATDFVHWKDKYDVFLESRGFLGIPGAQLISPIVFWLPPMIVLVLCQALLKPVYSGVRGIEWTRAELVRQKAYGLGASFVPILLMVSGVSRMSGDGALPSFLVSFAVAIVCIVFFGRRLRKLMQLSPFALTTGELRDRVFFLAAQLRVKLKQIYLLPPNKSRLANADARSGHSILLTHFLLSHLTRREVDAMISHELAHLKHGHPKLLGFAMMGGFALIAIPYFMLPWPQDWKPLFDVLFILVPLLAVYFVARRFEFTADATSVRTTGDPEALITCLVKLHRLNLMPLQWGRWNEKLMTHPSTVRRAESIARLSGLSNERLAELLNESAQPPSWQPR